MNRESKLFCQGTENAALAAHWSNVFKQKVIDETLAASFADNHVRKWSFRGTSMPSPAQIMHTIRFMENSTLGVDGLLACAWLSEAGAKTLFLLQLVEPYPGKPAINPIENLKKQNYTGLKMFQTADDFYHNMGMRRVPESFWNKSMLTKPTDGREVRRDNAMLS